MRDLFRICNLFVGFEPAMGRGAPGVLVGLWAACGPWAVAEAAARHYARSVLLMPLTPACQWLGLSLPDLYTLDNR